MPKSATRTRKTKGPGVLQAPDPPSAPASAPRERRALEAENASLRARQWDANRNGRERQSWLFAFAPVGLLLLDEIGVVLEVNRTAAQILEVSRGALFDMPLASFVAVQDRGVFLRHVRTALSRPEPVSCQVCFLRGSGGHFMAYVQSQGAKDSMGRRGVSTVISSATERYLEERAHVERVEQERQLREAIAAAERRFEHVSSLGALVSESLDLEDVAARAARVPLPELASFCAIDVADAGGHVRRVASACADGYLEPSIDPYVPRGSAAVVRTGHAQILPWVSQGDLLGLVTDPADFSRLWNSVRAYLCLPLQARGRTLGAMTFVRAHGPPYTADEIKLAEEIARQASAVLQGALLYRAAQEADRKKDEFLAMLGHELRNPLAAIVLAAARVRATCQPPAQKAADIIGRQSQRLTRLVDDLLDVSRVTRGQITLVRAPVDVAEVIATAVESVRPALASRRHELVVKLPKSPLVVDGDAARLEQVLVNLLGNSARYTDPGGHIHVEAARDGGDALIRVSDDGIGMDRATLISIFDPFTRFAPSLDRGDRGLGIGLTLSRALVELHGGSLTAESAGPGRGSELTLRLPMGVTAEHPVTKNREEPCHVNGKPVRLLVVEDEPDVAEMTRDRLTGLGVEVRVARDGVAAIDAALDFQPQLLLVDLGLPGMSGYDVVRRLRHERSLDGATFVALSGYGDDATRKRSLEAGFDCHFTKPLGDEALTQLLGGGAA